MCTRAKVDVQYVTFLLSSLFGWFYAIMQAWGHVKLLEEVFGGLMPWSKAARKRVASGISGGRWIKSCVWMQEGVFEFLMDNYVERSSLGTIMGLLYMFFCVWHDKDGAMFSFLWKLWASSVWGGHVGSDCRQSQPFELIWRPFLALKVPMDGQF